LFGLAELIDRFVLSLTGRGLCNEAEASQINGEVSDIVSIAPTERSTVPRSAKTAASRGCLHRTTGPIRSTTLEYRNKRFSLRKPLKLRGMVALQCRRRLGTSVSNDAGRAEIRRDLSTSVPVKRYWSSPTLLLFFGPHVLSAVGGFLGQCQTGGLLFLFSG
jgi:hypothetical protein